jgi:hypothetical protein
MNDNWLKYLVAISAILIAGSAAYFSVTGLGVLFSGAAIAVMVMAASLEFAKLVTATYLKQKWSEIGGLNKWYLTSAVAILMLITSAGIFGYLSNAFQQQNLQLQQVDREILVHSTKIKQNEDQIKQLSTQITESNTNQGKILDNGKVNSRLLRSVDNRDKQISKLNDRIAILQKENASENDSINKIKTDNISIEKEVGGFRFVAEAFGVELNSVVKFFIILIVIVFDPLAVALIISFNQLTMNGRKKEEEESKPEDLKDFVDESSRLHLSEDDLKKLEEVLLNPPFPNEKLKEAAERYSEEVKERYKDVNVDFSDEYKRRGELLSEMMQLDQELGLYEEPFDNPLVKEEIVNETPVTREETQIVFKERNFKPLVVGEKENDDDMSQRLKDMDEKLKVYEAEYVDEDFSDWDVTLMDGLEDEEPFFTEEELIDVFQEEPTEEEIEQNFSTIEPIPSDLFQEDEQFNIPVDEAIDNEPVLTFEEGQLPDEFLNEQPNVEDTSSENEDEKKNS